MMLALIVVYRKSATMVEDERHPTLTAQDRGVLQVTGAGMLLIYIILPITVYLSPDTDWYSKGGLLSVVRTLGITNGFLIPLLQLVDFGPLVKMLIKGNWKRQSTMEQYGCAGLLQMQYNKLFEPPEMKMAMTITRSVKLFWMVVCFTPFFPWMALLGFFGLFVYHRCIKYRLCRVAARPYMQSHVCVEAALYYIYRSAGLQCVATWWFLSPSIKDEAETWLLLVALVAGAVVVALWALKRFSDIILQRLGMLSFQRKETATDVDYYEAQLMWPKDRKYHTSHRVYQHFEFLAGVYRARGKPAPLLWEPKYGNIKDPTGAVPEAADEAGSNPTVSKEEEEEGAPAEEEAPKKARKQALEAMKVAMKLKARKWKNGSKAVIKDLISEKAQVYNETICTLIRPADESGTKWLVKLHDGKDARLPTANLTLTYGVS